MSLIVITPPAPLVTATQAKARIPALADVDDAIWEQQLAAATDLAELRTGRALGVQSLRWSLDGPTDCCWLSPRAALNLPRPPFRAVSGVTYLDADGVSQTFDPASYVAVGAGAQGRLVLKAGSSWPAFGLYPEALTVTFEAGYDTVPAAILGWIVAQAADAVASLESAAGDLRSVAVEGVGTVTYANATGGESYLTGALNSSLDLYRVDLV
jgi:uncharacterized phiE125 gp8 family phage protein